MAIVCFLFYSQVCRDILLVLSADDDLVRVLSLNGKASVLELGLSSPGHCQLPANQCPPRAGRTLPGDLLLPSLEETVAVVRARLESRRRGDMVRGEEVNR